jgi:CubicO group peptidase (beta-lactamase class C family)
MGLAGLEALLPLLLSLQTGPAPASAPAGEAGPSLAVRLDARLRDLGEKGFSGTVLVTRGSEEVLHRGYGWSDGARKHPITPATPYCVASISKQFCAAAILRLAEGGKLEEGDRIGKFLDGVPPDKEPITLRDLLTHRSGLPQAYAADGIADRGEAVRVILKLPLRDVPGASFSYANDGYSLLAAIVEVASGQTFETYLRENLLRPAGMVETRFWGEIDPRDPAAFAQVATFPDGEWGRANWGWRGGTGMVSTPRDLLRWYVALKEGRILGEEARRRLFGPHVKLPETEVGFGWFWSGTPRGTRSLWTRGTEQFGHNALLVDYLDEGTVLVMASNAGEIDGVGWNRRIKDELEGVLFPDRAPPARR